MGNGLQHPIPTPSETEVVDIPKCCQLPEPPESLIDPPFDRRSNVHIVYAAFFVILCW